MVGNGCRSSRSLSLDPQTSESSTVQSTAQQPALIAPLETEPFVPARLVDLAAKKNASLPETCHSYVGGVVNHHALANDLLNDFFYQLVRCRPDINRVIIFSPDHYQAGMTPITVHTRPYRTRGGELKVDKEAVQRLKTVGTFVSENGKPFEREHGIGALIPFLANASSSIKVVPLLVRADIFTVEANKTAAWLQEELRQPGTLVVVSADMSHYLSVEEARKKDGQTLKALQANDQAFFWSALDDHVDNGKSLWIVLQALEQPRWYLNDQAISTDYAGSSDNTTTYITGFWEAGVQ